MNKPRKINLEGSTVEVMDCGYGLSTTIWIDVLTFDISSARRLHEWLGKAIEWMKEKEKAG